MVLGYKIERSWLFIHTSFFSINNHIFALQEELNHVILVLGTNNL